MAMGLDAGADEENTESLTLAEDVPECPQMVRRQIKCGCVNEQMGKCVINIFTRVGYVAYAHLPQ